MNEVERFWLRVKVLGPTECWERAGRQGEGYSVLRVEGKMARAHRFSYELHFGPIPAGMLVCHKCDNRCCVNPNHLFLGSTRDNMLDMTAKGRNGMTQKSYCPHGHIYDDKNTYRGADGKRRCRKCIARREQRKRVTTGN